MKNVYVKYGLILAAGIVVGVLVSKYRLNNAAKKAANGEEVSSFCGCGK